MERKHERDWTVGSIRFLCDGVISLTITLGLQFVK